MKTIPVTDFRKNASSFIDEVEHGETLILVRRGKPVAEVIPFSGRPEKIPAWKQPSARLQIEGSDLSSAILEDREAST
jgi:prevent-host-death family protein